MHAKISRRHALALGSSAVAILPILRTQAQALPPGPFQHGVASGDSGSTSVVIWSRVSGVRDKTAVQWDVSADDTFSEIVARGELHTSQERDYTVKVLVTNLQPGHRYFYRFKSQGSYSPTGKTRTLPVGEVPELSLAIASCSNYPFGYFNAYESIASDESIEWVLHLGDYIYEYGVDGFGGEVGQLLGRDHQPRHEIVSLQDYRQRHAQYKADPQSQLMHAAHPLLAIWDDHEVTNNPWMEGAQNHQAETEGEWHFRKAAALQAYFEWMPVRDPAPGHSRSNYWRHWKFGNLASLISLETRHSGRAEQIEYDEHTESLKTPESAQEFLRDVVGAPNRPMLSPAMEAFIDDALRESLDANRPWRLLANQIPMARTLHPGLTQEQLTEIGEGLSHASMERLEYIAKMGHLKLPLYLDPWDGYPLARERFYALSANAGASDLVVLTGDSHSFWANQLFDAQGKRMGVEIGTTGITSPGDFLEFGANGATVMDSALAAANPEIVWTEGRYTGYIKLRLTKEECQAEFRATRTQKPKGPEYQLVRSMTVVPSDNSLSYK